LFLYFMNIYNFPSCDLTLINVQLAVLEGKSRHQRIACIIVKSKHFKVFRSKLAGSQNTCISFLSSLFLDAKTMYICKFICDHTLFILLYLVITVFHLDQGMTLVFHYSADFLIINGLFSFISRV